MTEPTPPAPHDPGPHWGEVGIHGLHRRREWDAVLTITVPERRGDHAVVVSLPAEEPLVEDGPAGFDPSPFLRAVRLPAPFRAVLRWRDGDVWAVGVCRLRTVALDPDPGGAEIHVVWDGNERTVTVDGSPALVSLPELGRVRSGAVGPYAATLRRLTKRWWEVDVVPL